ncbi:sulfatase [Gimesia panareensis]|uniref:sulfatase n=1 Tax=Gimesia panareensis TaxID=2527978 RepID=UPI001187CF99|nr:sulfatase [Gimesia panareensis]QDU50262.1 Arylsulfatase [Gimesia panareensis]
MIVRVSCCLLMCFLACSSSLWAAEERLNVLFIAVDDLRPELGCYGQPVKSPHIDQLAREGMLFERAYVQVALCMPSRASMLTGRRPDTTKVYQFDTDFRDAIPDVVTLPQYFKQQGYHALALGKIFHKDDKTSWSEPLFRSKRGENDYHTEFGKQVMAWIKEDHRKVTYVWDLGDGITKTKRPGGLPWEAPDIPDDAVRDGQLAEAAIDRLRKYQDKPFFLAVGFHKPHLPFVAPKKYFDLYDPGSIAPASNPFPPQNVPKYATYNWNDLRHYYGIPDVGPVSPQQARELKHAYYACVSFVDAQVGKVLAELKRLGLDQKTIVVLWGDHGWQLGEHGMWDKHSNFETSTRIPLIVKVPGFKPGRTQALVESVDLFPTLCELTGLPREDGLEGLSFVPLLKNPDRPWKQAAFSQYRRVIPGYGKISKGMGYSMRTDRYRFTEWLVPGTDFREYELYDHERDPEENVNLAVEPQYRPLLQQLKQQLHAGWRGALPAESK